MRPYFSSYDGGSDDSGNRLGTGGVYGEAVWNHGHNG
jgi:hypothetical protein